MNSLHFVPPNANEPPDDPKASLPRTMAPPARAAERVRVLITPELARQWLARNHHNRPLSDTLVITYAVDMLDGRWQYNGDAIRFDTEGHLIDGQHRLQACVEAGVPFETDVIFGLAPEAIRTIDIGKVRTAGHIAHLEGVPHAATATAVAALIMLHGKHGIQYLNDPSRQPSKTQIVEAARNLPRMEAAVAKASVLGRKIAAPRIIGFCYWVFAGQDPGLAERFFEELAHGVNLSSDNPVYALRERLLADRRGKAKLPPLEIIALFFKAWIAYRVGRPVRKLFWRSDGPAPEKFPDLAEGKEDETSGGRRP